MPENGCFLCDQGPLSQHWSPGGLLGFQSNPLQLALMRHSRWHAAIVSAERPFPPPTAMSCSVVHCTVQTERPEPTARSSAEMLTVDHNQAKEMFFVSFLKKATVSSTAFAHTIYLAFESSIITTKPLLSSTAQDRNVNCKTACLRTKSNKSRASSQVI